MNQPEYINSIAVEMATGEREQESEEELEAITSKLEEEGNNVYDE